jgi:pilus assembly protein Flp/PilA
VLAVRTIGRKLRSDKRGVTVIEYGLIAALIAIAIMGALRSLGGGAGGMWSKLSNEVTEASS